MNPVRVIIPKGSLLHPSDTAAVVGGNVLTSQRVVDVVLKAFEVCAASQGCMNNITFGEEKWGYYETVAGGAGAVSKQSDVFMVTEYEAALIWNEIQCFKTSSVSDILDCCDANHFTYEVL